MRLRRRTASAGVAPRRARRRIAASKRGSVFSRKDTPPEASRPGGDGGVPEERLFTGRASRGLSYKGGFGPALRPAGTIPLVAEHDDKPLSEQLDEVRAQLDWVRDYL